MIWPAIVILIVVGSANIGCGYLIWRKRVYGLIAGFDPRRPPRDPEGLARWVGKGSIVIGVWCIAAALALGLFPTHGSTIMRLMALAVLPTVAVLFIGGLKRAAR